jgi:hypothetical protein
MDSEAKSTSVALLTMHCTLCDYSLKGLPRFSKCAECGTPDYPSCRLNRD